MSDEQAPPEAASTQDPTQLPAGSRLGNYEIEEHVGQGAFGVVYRARHVYLPRRQVAIKIPTSDDYVRELRHTGALQGLVDHPAVTRVLDMDLSYSPPYLAMEWVEGETLRELLTRRAHLEGWEVVSLTRQILQALASAHEAGIVHRDLKPSNIMVTRYGGAKVTDFGLACIEDQVRRSLMLSLGSNGAERLVGTFEYMAPEQREGREVDARADLFAVGVLLFEMLTGRRPTINDRLPPPVSSFERLFQTLCCPLDHRVASALDALGALESLGITGERALWIHWKDPYVGEITEIWVGGPDCFEEFGLRLMYHFQVVAEADCESLSVALQNEAGDTLEELLGIAPEDGWEVSEVLSLLEQQLTEFGAKLRRGQQTSLLGPWADLLHELVEAISAHQGRSNLSVWATDDSCDLAQEMLAFEANGTNRWLIGGDDEYMESLVRLAATPRSLWKKKHERLLHKVANTFNEKHHHA